MVGSSVASEYAATLVLVMESVGRSPRLRPRLHNAHRTVGAQCPEESEDTAPLEELEVIRGEVQHRREPRLDQLCPSVRVDGSCDLLGVDLLNCRVISVAIKSGLDERGGKT